MTKRQQRRRVKQRRHHRTVPDPAIEQLDAIHREPFIVRLLSAMFGRRPAREW